jgi:hypothetical protein
MSVAIQSKPALIPEVGAEVLLMHKTGGKLVTRLDGVTQYFWTLRLSAPPLVDLVPDMALQLNYSDGLTMFSGACKIQSLAQGGRVLVIKTPNWTKSRPLRLSPRFDLSLPASVVLPKGDFVSEFVPRTEARILNISQSGVLLGLRAPLPENNHRILVLTDTKYMLGAAGVSALFSAEYVRHDTKSSNAKYPCTYGLAFGSLPPLYKQALAALLDKMSKEQKPSPVSSLSF